MRFVRLFLGLLTGITGLSAFQLSQAEKTMDSLKQQIIEKFSEFEKTQDADLIHQLLDSIEASEVNIPAGDEAAQNLAVSRRLHFLAALDRSIDPAWNSKDVPPQGVPAPAHQGMVYSSGEVDPETIPDPEVRAQYVQALKANKDARRRYSVQLELRRIDDRAMRFAERFLADRFGNSQRDHQEFEQLLAASPVNETRKERLRELLSKSR